MPTFGFSAYLKLICLNSKPQSREVSKRLAPQSGSGYDFHKSLRLLARRYLLEGEDALEIGKSVDKITKEAERNSVRSGLKYLIKWRSISRGTICNFHDAVFESPSGVFKVKFAPDFGIEIGGRRTAVHIWNTKRPELDRRFVYGALALFPKIYQKMANRPDDLAVLSLRDERLYCLSDVRDATAFGLAVATAIEHLFQDKARELGLPKRPPGPGPFPPFPTVP